MLKRAMKVFAVTVCFAFALSGCTSKETDVKTANKKQVIRMTYAANELDGQSTDIDVIFENFYKKHPNCEVVLEEGGTALMAKIAANDAPDIIKVKSVYELPTYVNKKLVLPLDDLLSKSELYDKDDIFPLCIDSFRFDGKEFGKGTTYGLPKDWSPSGMWVNKSMLENAGLEVPTIENPLTYKKLAKYAEKLTKKEGNKILVFGLADVTEDYVTIEKMLNLQGKSMWSEDFSKTNMKDPDVRDSFKYLYDLKFNGYANSKLYPMDGNGNPEFSVGKVAMNMSGLYSGFAYEKNPDRTVDFDDMVFCPSPIGDDSNSVTETASPVGAVISASSKNVDLIFDCWEYIHLGELADRRAALGFNLPVKKSVAEKTVISSSFQAANYKYAVELAGLDYMFIRTNPYISSKSIAGVMEKYFTPLLYGQYDFDRAMNLIESEIQLLVDEGMVN